jgi:hypothetical protein
MPFISALGAINSTKSSTMAVSDVGSGCKVRRPASILEKSRRSSINVSNASPDVSIALA